MVAMKSAGGRAGGTSRGGGSGGAERPVKTSRLPVVLTSGARSGSVPLGALALARGACRGIWVGRSSG
eukprot:15455681-Alexandrium_andersonii.AAC.1